MRCGDFVIGDNDGICDTFASYDDIDKCACLLKYNRNNPDTFEYGSFCFLHCVNNILGMEKLREELEELGLSV